MSVEITIEGESDIARLFQTLPPEIFAEVQERKKETEVRVEERDK